MTDKPGELSIDPKAAAMIQRWLLPEERILWTGRSTRIDREDLLLFALAGCFYGVAAPSILFGDMREYLWPVVIIIPAILALGLFSRLSWNFSLTTRRVFIANGFFPIEIRSWPYERLDPHWIKDGRGQGIIDLNTYGDAHGSTMLMMDYQKTTRIKGLPEIEAVRSLILDQIDQHAHLKES